MTGGIRGQLTYVKLAHRWSTILPSPVTGAVQMLEVIMLAIGLGFFVFSIGYACAREKL
jgi:hypothetical protein